MYYLARERVAIAYSVVGDGPVTIVVVSPLISQLELAWEEPALEHFWSRFAACARVVLFDRRGAGLSDRSLPSERLGLAALALDVEALCRWAATIDVRPLLAGVRVPVLVIHRQGDPVVPAWDSQYLRNAAQAAAKTLPHGRLAVLLGQGHDINPGATAPVMAEFLAS